MLSIKEWTDNILIPEKIRSLFQQEIRSGIYNEYVIETIINCVDDKYLSSTDIYDFLLFETFVLYTYRPDKIKLDKSKEINIEHVYECIQDNSYFSSTVKYYLRAVCRKYSPCINIPVIQGHFESCSWSYSNEGPDQCRCNKKHSGVDLIRAIISDSPDELYILKILKILFRNEVGNWQGARI